MDGVALGCVGVFIASVVFGLTLVLPVVTAVRLHRAIKLVGSLRSTVQDLEARLVAASRNAPVSAPSAEPAAKGAAPQTRSSATPLDPPRPEPGTRECTDPSAVAPASQEAIPAIAATFAPTISRPTSQVALAPPQTVPSTAVISASATASVMRVVPQPDSQTREPVRTLKPDRAPADTLEARIGGRWLLYIGTAVLVFGIGFFVKYAFDNQWVTETARVVLGAVVGLVMVATGRRFVSRGYNLYGEIVAGGGFVALSVSTWAALNLYGLISRPVAFGLMVLMTAGAAVMADRLVSQALAFVAVIGGFLTPTLVGGPEDAQVVLFTYVAMLVAGTMYLVARHDWRWLNLVSYALTLLTFVGWAAAHYTAAKYLPTQFFLAVFAGMFGWLYLQEWRSADSKNKVVPVLVLGSIPLLFHLASVANLVDHSLAFLVYVIAVTLAGVMLSVRVDRPWIRLATFVAVTPVFLAWVGNHTASSWVVAGAVVLAAEYAMHLAGVWERIVRQPDPWPRGDLVLFHLNALALFGGLYILVDANWPYSTPFLALGLAAWHGALAWRLRAQSGEAAVNGLAAAFAMLGFAIGLRFDDWWALVGWVTEAGAIYWAGLRMGRAWMRLGGGILLVAVLARFVTMDFFDTPAGFAAVWNPRVGATLVIIGVMYVMSAFYRRFVGPAAARRDGEYAALLVGANVLAVLLLSVEINSYWRLRSADDATASLALLASLSMAWGLYGTALVAVGIQRRYAPLRYLAVTLLLVTVGKVFLIDLSQLGGIYRIIGFMGLGVFLLLGAWLYQRYRDVILGA